MQRLTRFSRSSQIFIALTILYFVVILISPISQKTKMIYDLTDSQYYLVIVAARLPFIVAWAVAFASYRALHDYVVKLAGTPEERYFSEIRRGMFWIAWGLLIPALVYAVLSGITNKRPDLLSFNLIITNYLYVIISLIAFSYICNGAYRLARKYRLLLSTVHIRLVILLFAALSVLFCYVIAAKLHATTNLQDTHNAYFLPNALVWLTIVIPYLYAWFTGIFAAVQLLLTADHSKGIIYRKALRYVAVGLVLTIASMTILQYYRSIIPRTGYLVLGANLLTSYVIYAVNIVGSVFLIFGARKLTRIEEA